LNFKHTFRKWGITTLFLMLWLAGCGPGPTTPGAPSSTASQPPSLTPTALPVPVSPTPVHLSPENVKSIVPLRRFGLGTPTDLAYSPDGSLIAVSSSIGVYRYDARNFEELPLIETSDYVWTLAFSPDGHLIATGEENGLRLWDAEKGTLVRSLEEHMGSVEHLAFSLDGQLLASVAYDLTLQKHIVKIWRVEDGTLQVESAEPAAWITRITALRFSPRGDLLVVGLANGTFSILDGADGHLIRNIEGHTDDVTSIAFSPGGRVLATASADRTLQLWLVSEWKRIDKIFVTTPAWITDLAYSPDGKILAANGDPVQLRDTGTGKLLEPPPASGDHIAFSPDGTLLAVLGDQLELWRLANHSLEHSWDGYTDGIWSLAASPDGHTLAAGGWNAPIRLWQTENGNLLRTLEPARRNVLFSPNGQTLVAVSDVLQFWQPSDGILLNTNRWLDKADSAAFSPDGQLLAVGLDDSNVEILSFPSRKRFLSLKWETKYSNWVYAVAFSPDGRLLATGDFDKKVRLWQVSDGQSVSVLEGHSEPVEDVAFSPDGTLLASASADHTVRLWRVEDGSLLQVLEHSNTVNSVAFSPDGKLLASASSDGALKLWDLEGNLLVTLSAHTGAVTGVVFLPDGRTLASSSSDGTIWLWGFAP